MPKCQFYKYFQTVSVCGRELARVDDRTLILADIGRKAIHQVKNFTEEFLQHRLPKEEAQALAEKLSTGAWTHDYPILAREAKELGLPVSTDMPAEVFELMRLYPQPVRSQPGVWITCRYRGKKRQRQERRGGFSNARSTMPAVNHLM
jgi:ClpP class serine protease